MEEDFDDFDDVVVGEDGWTDYERASNEWWLKNIDLSKVCTMLKETSSLIEKQDLLKNAPDTIQQQKIRM